MGAATAGTDWPVYGGNAAGQRYSPLQQITPENVADLEPAWVYHTGDMVPDPGLAQRKLPAFEATPILVDGTLYACTPRNWVVALDPATGAEKWLRRYHSTVDANYVMTCRGVSFYRSTTLAPDALCATRILMGTWDGKLVALDARSGAACPGFGDNGQVDLRSGLGEIDPRHYKMMSPPLVTGNRIIVGALSEDNQRVDAPPGVVRAYDADSGALVWSWDPLPPGWQKDSDGAYQKGTPNAWSTFSVDSARGLVFIPTGNAAPDHYSAERRGLDYFSSSVVALHIDSGELAWRFQTVHHDVWDYDVASQPVLFDLPGEKGVIPALAQATKPGFIFILNRETGVPLFPVHEMPMPQSSVPGMLLSPTQPIPEKPAQLVPARLTADDMWGFTPWDRAACAEAFKQYDYEGVYTPPSERGTLIFPSIAGGSNWGSVAIDPQRMVMVANYNRFGTILKLIPRAEADARTARGEPPVYPVTGSSYAYDMLPFLSPLGAPCNSPPWGGLRAIDLKTGETLWDVPLGTTRDQAPFPLWLNLGVPNQGGALLTASGLIFIGAATDNYIRAFSLSSGTELWRERLPAGGQATPMTYALPGSGKQYVVISAGGHAYLGTTLGDAIVAYSLP